MTATSDVYALGLLLHHMLVGKLPWPVTDDVAKIRPGQPTITVPALPDVPGEIVQPRLLAARSGRTALDRRRRQGPPANGSASAAGAVAFVTNLPRGARS